VYLEGLRADILHQKERDAGAGDKHPTFAVPGKTGGRRLIGKQTRTEK